MTIHGIVKARNEAHIIKDTLDNWSQVCDRIHVYDDHSEDDTPDICRRHPQVVEVITSNLLDPDRQRSEWFNRQILLASAKRFMAPEDWVVYFDADEHIYDWDPGSLLETDADAVAFRSFDTYITPEDACLPAREYAQRRWVGPEWEVCIYFYRNFPTLRFHLPDQRHMTIGMGRPAKVHVTDRILHWGQGISVDAFEKKVDYYTGPFGDKYRAKWEKRRGKAVQEDMKSRYGNPLVAWEDVRAGRAETVKAHGLEMVK